MSSSVQVIADSIGVNGARLTTFQLRMPRFILAQFNTHRAISKNARSSRAVPTEKLILEVETNPVIPSEWGKNRRGMQATEALDGGSAWRSQQAWLDARDAAVAAAHRLLAIGLHKQVANRLLEPFLWVDVVATATDWSNFFALRCHDAAQPEMRELAVAMATAYRDSRPAKRPAKEIVSFPSDSWHLPYVTDSEREQRGLHTLLALSVARCARVSYTAFDGTPSPTKADLILHNKLRDEGHFSPFEHQGRCQGGNVATRSGNFSGWWQYRQTLPKSVHTSFDFGTLDAPKRRGYVVEGRVAGVSSNVDHPAHYNAGSIEVIEAIEDWGLGFNLGNSVKYIARAGRKDPVRTIEDLEKAAWYLDREISTLKAKEGGK